MENMLQPVDIDKETRKMSDWAEKKAREWNEELKERGWRVEFVHGQVFRVPEEAPVNNAGELLKGVDIHLSPIPFNNQSSRRVKPFRIIIGTGTRPNRRSRRRTQ